MKGEIQNRADLVADATTAFQTAGYDAILFIVVKTGATTFKLQDSDDGTTYADVDAKFVIDDTAAAAGTYKASYIGCKKYVKAVLGTAANGSVIGVKFNPVHQG